MTLDEVINNEAAAIADELETVTKNYDDLRNSSSNRIINAIIQNGGKVKIIHERYVADNPYDADVMRTITSWTSSARTSARRITVAKQLAHLGIRLERNSKSGEFHRHNVVFPFGGRTTVSIKMGDKEVETSSDCAICDNFNRKIGIAICLEKIFEQMAN